MGGFAPYNTVRDDEIAAGYLAGLSCPEIAQIMGMNTNTVNSVLHRRQAKRTPEERARITAATFARVQADPAFQARRVARLRAARTVWPDCPPERRDEYMGLRKLGYSATEARRMTEEQMRKDAR